MRDAALIATLGVLLAAVLAQPFIGVLLWNWIAFMNPHRLAYGFAAELPWAFMVLAATLIGCVMAGELRLPPMNATTLLLVALMLCFTATSLVALGEPTAVWEKWERSVKVLLGLLLTMAMITNRLRLHALIWVMVISLGYYGVRGGLFALLTGGSYRVWGPPQTMITDNNHLAAALLISLPLMNFLRLQSAHRAVRIGLGVAMALTLLAVVASYSRGALLGLGAVLGMLWLMSARKLLLGAGLALCLTGIVAFMPGGWSERMEGITSYQADESASERLVLWGISWRLALDRPLVGSGFTGPYNRAVVDRVAEGGPARAVHSIWFELLGEHGFPTFIIWAALSAVGLWHARQLCRLARDHPTLAWAGDLGRMGMLAIIAYLVSGSFLSLSYWDFYWTLLVVLAGARGLVLAGARGLAVPLPIHSTARGWRGATQPTQ